MSEASCKIFFNLQIPTLLLMIPIILFVVIGVPTGLLDFSPDGEQIVHSHFFSTWLVDNYNVHFDKEMLTVLVMGVDAATTRAKSSLEKGFADAE
ncbi:MAG: hypothetical protein KQI81_23810 [Deltaproteobacteria bacterium]|nr:hypothetical protein [Deltaproteobacteria bacterium]